jgi:hypothetical protein
LQLNKPYPRKSLTVHEKVVLLTQCSATLYIVKSECVLLLNFRNIFIPHPSCRNRAKARFLSVPAENSGFFLFTSRLVFNFVFRQMKPVDAKSACATVIG